MSAVTGTCTARVMRATRANISSRGMRSPSGYPSEKAMPADVVAMAGKPASSKMRALATSQTFGSTSTPGPRCRSRNRRALSALESINSLSSQTILALPGLIPHPLEEARDMHHGASHSPAPDFLYAIVRFDPHDVKPSVERLQFRRGANAHSDAAGRAVLDVDRNPNRNFSLFTIRLQRLEAGRFHQTDHVGSRVHRRQFGMMRGQRMLQFHRLVGFTSHSDGDRKGHTAYAGIAWTNSCFSANLLRIGTAMIPTIRS